MKCAISPRMTEPQKPKLAIVWRGAPGTTIAHVPETSRLYPVALALQGRGFDVEPVVYNEDDSRSVRERLRKCDGVLVWVDPLTDGKDRRDLDAILRELSSQGIWLGSHPDVILKMGTKEVLYRTRDVGWGSDTHLYETFAQFGAEFPKRLTASGTRVLKRQRGNGGQGVWKVTLRSPDQVSLQEATQRDGAVAEATLASFIASCEAYFASNGVLLDQAFQPRIVEGMIRSYMSGSELVGFARQYPKGYAEGAPDRNTFGLPAAKTMYGSTDPQFARLRMNLESEWIPRMCKILALDESSLPALWDADFLFGPRTPSGEDTLVLCEINASCITPFPPDAPAKIAERAATMVASSRENGTAKHKL
jgi:hypothetical protein